MVLSVNLHVFIFIFSCMFSGVLVGNKSDLSTRREVQASVAEEWAQSQGMKYFETSAVSSLQVFVLGMYHIVHVAFS